jgi:hypothetical protein
MKNTKLRTVIVCDYNKKNYFRQANDTSLLTNNFFSLIHPHKFVVKKHISSDTRYTEVYLKFIYQIFTLITVQSKGVWFVSIVFVLYKTTAVKDG